MKTRKIAGYERNGNDMRVQLTPEAVRTSGFVPADGAAVHLVFRNTGDGANSVLLRVTRGADTVAQVSVGKGITLRHVRQIEVSSGVIQQTGLGGTEAFTPDEVIAIAMADAGELRLSREGGPGEEAVLVDFSVGSYKANVAVRLRRFKGLLRRSAAAA